MKKSAMFWVVWAVRLLIFIFVLSLAVMNTVSVPVTFFFGLSWEMPLVLVMLIFLLLGAILGIFAMLGRLWRLKRELSILRRHV